MNNSTGNMQEKNIPLLIKGHGDKYHFTESREVKKFINFALNRARKIVKAKYGNIYFFNSINQLIPFESLSEPDRTGEIISSYCIEKKCTLIIDPRNSSTIPDDLKEKLGKNKISSGIICIYMGLKDGHIGAAYFSTPKYDLAFSMENYDMLENLTSTFIDLIKNTIISAETGETNLNFKSSVMFLLNNISLTMKNSVINNQLRSILEVSNLINSSREITEVIKAVFNSARSVFRAESVSLFLLDKKTGELYFDVISEETARKLQGIRIPMGQGIVGLCAKEKKSILVNDAQKDRRVFKGVDEKTGNVTRNLIATPLVVNDEIIGVLEVMNTLDRPIFTQQEVEIFQSFADSVAIAIHRRGLLDDLQSANVQLEKKLKETKTLHSISSAILSSYDIESLFSSITKILHEVLNVGRAAIFLLDSEKKLILKSSSGDVLSEKSAKSEYVILNEAIKNNEFIILGDEHDSGYPCFNTTENSCSTCMLLPLVFTSSGNIFGALSLVDFQATSVTHEEIRLINTISTEISRAYENIYLSQQLMEIKTLEKEVEITSKIQQNILPVRMPEHCHLDLYAKSIMAKTMGGDFYDYYSHDTNGEITILVADVSGKSLPAALFMAASSSTLRTIIRTKRSPSDILTAGNKLIYEDSQSGMFVTVFLAHYLPAKGIMKYSSAGHNEMILMHEDGSYDFLSAKGTPVGTLPEFLVKFQEKQTPIQKNDILILYTDGVIEAINPDHAEYGMERFIDLLRNNRDKTPEEIIEITYKDVLDFADTEIQYDDFTMVVTKFKGTLSGEHVYREKFRVAVESIPLLRDYARNILQKHGHSGSLLDDILLAVDEAASNITIHAFRKKETLDEFFDFNIYVRGQEKLEIEFIDSGDPFNLEDVKEPDPNENLSGKRKGGFGIYLIRSLMDNIEYFREENLNRLILTKYFKN